MDVQMIYTSTVYTAEIEANASLTVGGEKSSADSPELTTQHSFFVMWTISVLVVTLTVVTIVGNVSVIAVYALSNQLQRFSNNFIISLAAADFTIGCCMPVNLMVTLSGSWPFQMSLCNVYSLFESSLCYTSFSSILMISLDRWWSIHWPFQYRVKQSRRRAVLIILTAWIFSLALFGPVNIIWRRLSGRQYEILTVSLKCTDQPVDDLRLILAATVLTFFLPLTVLIACNVSIYLKIARRKDNSIRRSVTSETFAFISRKSSSDSSCTCTADEQATELLRTDTNDYENSDAESAPVSTPPERPKGILTKPILIRRHSCAPCSIYNAGTVASFTQANKLSQYSRRVSFDMGLFAKRRRLTNQNSANSSSVARRRSSVNEELVRDIFSKQDRKAARALALLVVMVTICWAPNVILRIISTAVPGSIPMWVRDVSFWLVLLNSGLNPYLYATGNSKYRRTIQACFGRRKSENRRQQQTPPKYCSQNQQQQQQNSINNSTFRAWNTKNLSKSYITAVRLDRNILSNVILKPAEVV